jgi:hypothetical protein
MSETLKTGRKVGGNDPCPCGSGKQFKKRCDHNSHVRRLYYVPMSHGDWGKGAHADPSIRKCWSDIQAWLDSTALSFDKLYVDTNGGTDSFPEQEVPLNIDENFDIDAMDGPMWRVFASLGRRNPNIRWMPCDDPALIKEFDSFQQEMKAKHGNDNLGVEDTRRAMDIIRRRDEAIVENVDKTLVPGETGILFMGMLHNLDGYLENLLKSVGVDVQVADYDP